MSDMLEIWNDQKKDLESASFSDLLRLNIITNNRPLTRNELSVIVDMAEERKYIDVLNRDNRKTRSYMLSEKALGELSALKNMEIFDKFVNESKELVRRLDSDHKRIFTEWILFRIAERAVTTSLQRKAVPKYFLEKYDKMFIRGIAGWLDLIYSMSPEFKHSKDDPTSPAAIAYLSFIDKIGKNISGVEAEFPELFKQISGQQ